MKKHWILYGILAGTFATIIGQTLAQGGGWTPPEWLKPTEYHERFKKSVGEFDVAGEMWMAPGAPAQTFTGTAKREMILGGMFVQETFNSTWAGGPFEGRAIQGYDTVRKEFVTIWMDSGSPVVSVSRGQFEGGRVVMHSEDPDMQTGKLKKVRTTIGTTDDGKTVMTMFDVVPEGEDRMTMRLTYTKKE